MKNEIKGKDEELYELSENLRLQLVVLELEDKINKYMYNTEKEDIKKKYKILRIIRVILVFLYLILVFFEKPMFCYSRTTFYNRGNKTDNECPTDLVYLNSNMFLKETIYRYIEIAFLISFVFIKVMHFKLKNIDIFKQINIYNIIQYIIFLLIFLCLIDVVLSIILDYFPLINFFCRGILIILLIKSQREMWAIVFKIFYQTGVLTFLILCVMLFFGTVGYFLFGDKSKDFENVLISVYSLFILLSTCNFPDVMLGTFDEGNKFPFFYFLLYLAINYFILFTLLKTLYYSKFFDSLKERARKAIDAIFDEFHKNFLDVSVIDNEDLILEEEEEEKDENIKVQEQEKEKNNDKNSNKENKEEKENDLKTNLLSPEQSHKFNEILFNLNKKFYLTKNDYIKILKLIGYKGELDDFTKNDIYNLLNQKENNTKEEIAAIKNSNIFLRFFSSKYTEIGINIIDFGIMMLLLIEIPDTKKNFIFVLIPQIVWCTIFIFEFIIYVKHFPFKYLILNEFVLFCFFIINCITLLFLLLTFISLETNAESAHTVLMNIVKVFVCMRMIRIFLLFKKYNTFETFSKTIHNMKNLFYSLFSTLFSFYYIFTTITMFLTGGHITKNIFDDDPSIPSEYSNINFNDFGSGFVSCFCLTMINNINIISRSLAVGCSDYYQGYFAFFYFLSTLIILNISTTLLLEMYMSIQAKMKEIQNKKKETDDEEMNIGE